MFDISKPVGVYESIEARIDVAAAVANFIGLEVPAGHIVIIEEAAITDITTAAKVLALGFKTHKGDEHWIKAQAGTNAYTCNLTAFPILREGSHPIAKVTTPSASDDLYFTVYGWLYKVQT